MGYGGRPNKLRVGEGLIRSFVAFLSRATIDHAPLSRRGAKNGPSMRDEGRNYGKTTNAGGNRTPFSREL